MLGRTGNRWADLGEVSRFVEKRRSNLTQNKVTRKTSDLSQDFKILQDFQEFHICE